MLSKYLSNWFGLVFLIWVLSYQLGFKKFALAINPYYVVLALFWGFLLLTMYMIFTLEHRFEMSFLVFLFVMHSAPLLLMLSLKLTSSKNAMRTLLLVTALYVIYLGSQGRGLTDSYFKDFYPTSWKDIEALCTGNPHSVCRIMRIIGAVAGQHF
jgi:hypothetical protein